MNNTDTIFFSGLREILTVLIIWLISGIFITVKGQEHPPRPVVVIVTTQNLNFGAFSPGLAGGTVTISATGSRSATGDVILLNLGYSFTTALYQVVANQGTVISILNGPNVTLTGSGGGTMTLQIGASSPASPFVISTVPPAFTLLNVGGTLTVGNILANPAGNYNGSFDITFIQE